MGESGCGKSTLGYTILQLERATAGEVFYDGQDLLRLKGSQLRPFRQRMQIIFQDPHSALDARMTIGDAIAEPLRVHKIVPRDEVADRVEELLKTVGLNPYFKNRYPHEFSGGQQQRIVIARALSVEPKFMICDEPISALDVSIQAQIINLLESLQDQFKLTYLFISHDLRVVRHISDRVAVMYLGKIVEEADANELHSNPLHPYTQALLSSVPVANPAMARQRATHHPGGGRAESDRPSERVPVPHSLPHSRRAVRAGGAGLPRGAREPLGGLPPGLGEEVPANTAPAGLPSHSCCHSDVLLQLRGAGPAGVAFPVRGDHLRARGDVQPPGLPASRPDVYLTSSRLLLNTYEYP